MVWCYEYISDSGIHIATYMYMYAIILYDEVYDSLPAAWCLNDLQDPNWNIKSDQIPDLRSGKFHRNAISLETPYLWEKENRKNPWKSSDFLGLKSRTFPKILRVSWKKPWQDPDGAYIPIWATDLRGVAQRLAERPKVWRWFDCETWRLNYESGPFTAYMKIFP